MASRGSLDIKTYDIEGCFPNMPKEAIKIATEEIIQKCKAIGYNKVWVAYNGKCQWKEPERHGKSQGIYIPLSIIREMIHFVLDNTFLRMRDGRYLQQLRGIPMGDNLSPGMTIGTCSWMENEWYNGLHATTKENIHAARYMDDIIIMTHDNWDKKRFLKDFEKSECYWQPLKLEETNDGLFLETNFQKIGNDVEYRLKNKNEVDTAVWRYHHYHSAMSIKLKRSCLMATLRKVHKMASNNEQLKLSGLAKLREFEKLGYPAGIRRYMCAIMARDNSNVTWRYIRSAQH